MSGVRGDARKRQQGEHLTHWDAGVRAVIEREVAKERERIQDPTEPWGPFEMGGFEGCTDRNPDYCACATDAQPICRLCGQEIEPGEQAWARQWPCYDTLPLNHADQEWDVIAWHDDCDATAIAREAGQS